MVNVGVVNVGVIFVPQTHSEKLAAMLMRTLRVFFVTHYYNLYFLTFCSDHNYTGIPCFCFNKIAFLLKSLNFADSHNFNHALISRITV